jgi:hypothetical protein
MWHHDHSFLGLLMPTSDLLGLHTSKMGWGDLIRKGHLSLNTPMKQDFFFTVKYPKNFKNNLVSYETYSALVTNL